MRSQRGRALVSQPRHRARTAACPRSSDHTSEVFSRIVPSSVRARCQLVPRASRSRLSPREHSILRSMSCGLSNKSIARELQIAPETVKSHVKGIFIPSSPCRRCAHAVSTAGALDCSEAPQCRVPSWLVLRASKVRTNGLAFVVDRRGARAVSRLGGKARRISLRRSG